MPRTVCLVLHASHCMLRNHHTSVSQVRITPLPCQPLSMFRLRALRSRWEGENKAHPPPSLTHTCLLRHPTQFTADGANGAYSNNQYNQQPEQQQYEQQYEQQQGEYGARYEQHEDQYGDGGGDGDGTIEGEEYGELAQDQYEYDQQQQQQLQSMMLPDLIDDGPPEVRPPGHRVAPTTGR